MTEHAKVYIYTNAYNNNNMRQTNKQALGTHKHYKYTSKFVEILHNPYTSTASVENLPARERPHTHRWRWSPV